jgi:hypothetical protein
MKHPTKKLLALSLSVIICIPLFAGTAIIPSIVSPETPTLEDQVEAIVEEVLAEDPKAAIGPMSLVAAITSIVAAVLLYMAVEAHPGTGHFIGPNGYDPMSNTVSDLGDREDNPIGSQYFTAAMCIAGTGSILAGLQGNIGLILAGIGLIMVGAFDVHGGRHWRDTDIDGAPQDVDGTALEASLHQAGAITAVVGGALACVMGGMATPGGMVLAVVGLFVGICQAVRYLSGWPSDVRPVLGNSMGWLNWPLQEWVIFATLLAAIPLI